MQKRVLSLIFVIAIIMSLCSCKKSSNGNADGSSSPANGENVSESEMPKLETREDYLNALYGYYETDEAYVFISADYYEEKSKTEEYDYRYGDVDAIGVSMGDNNITTYEISVYGQFVTYYAFDGKELKSSTGSVAQKITKEVYDKIPLKTYTYTPPVNNPTTPDSPVVDTTPDCVVPISQAEVGDIVCFGTYEQDGLTENGPEKIRWRVLEKKNGRLLVITEKVIAFQEYNKDKIHTNYPPDVTWEQCTLRTWLNNDFYNSVFTDNEKNQIPTVNVHTEGRNYYATTTGGNDTKDKMFCLSLEEAATYLKTTEGAVAYATRQVLLEEDWTTIEQIKSGEVNLDTTTDSYWLRTPGDYGNSFAMHIELDGEVNFDGRTVNSSCGVRPSTYIEIN